MKKDDVLRIIKEKVGEGLSEEQINELMENWNFEEYDVLPEIIITDDPFEFEMQTRVGEQEDYRYNGESDYSNTETSVLLGDYEPGIEDWYMDGNDSRDGANNRMADFSLNQNQVAIVRKTHRDNSYGNDINEQSETIYVYEPDKSKYIDEKTYQEMVFETNRNKLYQAIKDKVGDRLTDDQIKLITKDFYLDGEELPQIQVTENPYEFEKETRIKEDTFEHSWAGSTVDKRKTDVVIGDYKPGINRRYQYSNNGDTRSPKEEYEMSDFSLNEAQVAVVLSDYSDDFNGEDIDEHSETIQIYLPNEKQYPTKSSFKQMVLKERQENMYQAIKDKVGDRLTDDQIKAIIGRFNFESEKVPQIEVTENPYEFEKNSRRHRDTFEHSWAGSKVSKTETDVVIGDYQPGIDSRYQYSENGDTRSPKEEYEMSDFSLNDAQVAVVSSDYSDHYNDASIDKHSETIQIYLPDEKQYPSKSSFKQMVLKERQEKMYQAIKDKVGDRLTADQIKAITGRFDLESEKVPQIDVTENPYEFEKNSRRHRDTFKHSWAGSKVSKTETDVIIGDYQPGIDSRYQYSENGDTRLPKEEHEMSDFSLNDAQVAVVSSDYSDHYNNASIDKHSKTIQIYLPNEKQYPTQMKFRELLEKDKSALAKREEQLQALEKEEHTISEAEALINKQIQKGGQDK